MVTTELTDLVSRPEHLRLRLESVVRYLDHETGIVRALCIRHAAGSLRMLQRVGTTGQECEDCREELAARGER